jgi:hypothetical protein
MQLLTQIAEQGVQHRGPHPAPQEESQHQKIERFICLKAPTFCYSEDPMDTDDWLKVIETKLDLTDCNDEECVAITVHQLEGPAKS